MIIIADNNIPHYEGIRNAILSVYPAAVISRVDTLTEAITEANYNNNVEAIVRSYSGLPTAISLCSNLPDRVMVFYPNGANDFIDMGYPDDFVRNFIISGAGDDENKNTTAYSNGFEFWDNDLDSGSPDLSSYSNGVVCGKLLKIKHQRNCDWWEARYVARVTADREEPNRPANTIWHKENGFGKINVDRAIKFIGIIPDKTDFNKRYFIDYITEPREYYNIYSAEEIDKTLDKYASLIKQIINRIKSIESEL